MIMSDMTITEIASALDAFAGDIAESGYYITGEWRIDGEWLHIYTDESACFCGDCAKNIIALIAAGTPSEEEPPDYWGLEFSENDGCRHCGHCGRLLDYTLTDAGADEEYCHFLAHPPSAPLSREEAYHIARLLAAADYGNKGAHPGALRIGQAALAAVKKLKTEDNQNMTDWSHGGIPAPQAWRDVLSERVRQIKIEGWTPEHDDKHAFGELARAAACYAYWAGRGFLEKKVLRLMWPWEIESCKRKDARSDLVRAAALLLAEIERFDRKQSAESVRSVDGVTDALRKWGSIS